MKPTQILTEEHNLIKEALSHCTEAVSRLEQGRRPPREFFDKATTFASTFADKFHHFKEEHLMFRRLAEKHNGEIDAQIEALRNQHDQGRGCIAEIGRALNGYGDGQEAQTAIILENLSAYVSMLRRHIGVEDHTFYPMVDDALSDQEQQELVALFSEEDKKSGEKTYEECRQLVADMASLLYGD